MEIHQENLNRQHFERKWNFKGLFLCHLLIGGLLLSFFLPATAAYWEVIDVAIFRFLNGSLKGSPHSQLFWAMANHYYADWLEDLIILTFYILHVKKTIKEKRPRRIAELIFCVLYIAFIIIVVNRVFFRYVIVFHRDSPTLALDGSLRLSSEIPWMSIKDDSSKCFPGDHATTAILFAATYYLLAPKRYSILACLYTLFLCLPRITAGAHWFSDVIVGSGSIALFFLSWAFYTPLMNWIAERFEKLLFRLKLAFATLLPRNYSQDQEASEKQEIFNFEESLIKGRSADGIKK